MRDFCDRLGFIIETRARGASNYGANSIYEYSSAGVMLNYWLDTLRMIILSTKDELN